MDRFYWTRIAFDTVGIPQLCVCCQHFPGELCPECQDTFGEWEQEARDALFVARDEPGYRLRPRYQPDLLEVAA